MKVRVIGYVDVLLHYCCSTAVVLLSGTWYVMLLIVVDQSKPYQLCSPAYITPNAK